MDINNVNYFDALYIERQPKTRICLVGSAKFGELKLARTFTDEEKSDYIDELMERRSLRDLRRLVEIEANARGQSKSKASKDDRGIASRPINQTHVE